MLRSISSELILEVFSHFREDTRLLVAKPHLFPWYLGHICSAWRDVFISSSEFWTILLIDIESECNENEAIRRLEITRTCITRGANFPINFRFDFRIDCPCRTAYPAAHKILELLVANSARWRDVQIAIPDAAIPTLYNAKHRLPLLRSIQIGSVKGSGYTSNTLYNDLFADAPALTRISFNLISCLSSWTVNWHNLTALHWRSALWTPGILSCISRMHHLEKLVLRGGEPRDPSDDISSTRINLPYLKIFHLGRINALKWFHTPALEDLEVSNPNFNVEMNEGTISRYFRSLGKLKRLSIRMCSPSTAVSIIKYIPDIEHLSLIYIDYELLGLLPDCPNIRCLKILSLGVKPAWDKRDERRDALALQSWKEKGFVPTLKSGHIELHAVDSAQHSLHYMVQLKGILETQGIVNCSIRPYRSLIDTELSELGFAL